MSTVWAIIIGVVAFTVMIFVHELGHFAFAKLFKICVNEFAIGMGPALFKRKKGETLYSVRCIPFGGFCSMEGEDESSKDPHAFRNAARWKRAIVLFAGALLNILLGFVLFIIIAGNAQKITVPVVNDFIQNTYIETSSTTYMSSSGIMPGDRIIKLDGTAINIYDDFNFFMNRIDGTKSIAVTVNRDGQILSFEVMPSKYEEKYHFNEDSVLFESYVNGNLTETKTLDYSQITASDIEKGTVKTQSKYLLGFHPQNINNSFALTMHEAFYNTIFNVKIVYVSLYELITGKVPANQIMSAIGIIDMMGAVSRTGWMNLLSLIALITINLGVMNLLPIPALDGGRLVFLLVEGIIRKPIPPEKEGLVHMIGFILLIGLMILAAYNDIARLVTGWTGG